MADSRPSKRVKLEDPDSESDIEILPHGPPSKTIAVHPHGDTILCVSSSQHSLSLLVASGVLTAASPSWISLLEPNPHSASRPATPSDSPRHVPISVPDPTTLLDLCLILHHRPEQVEGSQGRPLLALALVANKLACEASLTLWMSLQLEKHLQSAQGPTTTLKPLPTPTPTTTPPSIDGPDELSVLEIMGIAYLFNDAVHFRAASRNLDHTFRMAREVEDLLPKPLMAVLRERRGRSLSAIREEVEGIVDSLFKVPNAAADEEGHGQVDLKLTAPDEDGPTGSGSGSGSACKQTLLTAGYFIGCLSNAGLWPKCAVEQDATYSVAEYLDRLEVIASYKKPGSKCTKARCKDERCGPCRGLDVREALMGVVERRRRGELVGFCLRCVKEGRCGRAWGRGCGRHGIGVEV